MSTDKFAHLHVHTEFSLLDGAGKIEDYFEKAAKDGQPALATTDHGNLHAWPELFRLGEEYNVKPIPGCELYLEPEIMGWDRKSIRSMNKAAKQSGDDSATGKQYFHQTTLAINEEGYGNLIKMQSRSWLDNYYYKPLTSLEMMDKFSAGIIATTSCLGGVVPQYLMKNKRKEAEDYVAQMVDIYGKDRYFVELQRHGIQEQDDTNPVLMEIAKKFDIKVIAANDCHYTNCSDSHAHDALLCVQTRSKMHDPDRFKFSGRDGAHALLTSEEMYNLFSDLGPEPCRNTLLIAEMVEPMSFGYQGYRMPHFPLPDEFKTEEEYLRHITYKGAHYRWGKDLTSEQTERLEYELGVICDMGFAGYFLILWDLCKYARRNDILVGPGRGSAAGSAVSYCAMITGVDPLQYDLLFERFLNPERVSMPDIDLDFDTRYRDELINYTAEKYGKDRVAQIVTFGKIKARSAIKDAARVLNADFSVGNAINDSMPDLIHGRDTPLWACMATSAPKGWEATWPQAAKLRKIYQDDPEAREVIDVALGLEGLTRSTGVHAAAVIIGDDTLENCVPLQKAKDGSFTSQWSMNPIEDLGLVKMDYLGLRNLDVISDTLRMIRKTRNENISMYDIPLDDKPTYDMLSAGKALGVFQLENSGMRNLLSEVSPNSIEDIAAVNALYRPGPLEMDMHTEYARRKDGTNPIKVLHPDAEPILKDTLGVLTYQESVMRIAQKFAGYTLGQADNLRKIVGKKKLKGMAKEKINFIQGCVDTGYGSNLGEKWWALIEPFGSYGFNKSHAIGYSILSYITAYLKCNYGPEYFSALLNSVKDKVEKAGGYIVEARAFGLEVLPPDINKSQADYFPEGDTIYVGLSAIKGVGDAPAQAIVAMRNKNKDEWIDFLDYIKRGPKQAKNKGITEALIKSGCFDSMHTRGGLLTVYENILTSDRSDAKYRDAGVISLAESIGDSGLGVMEIPNEPMEKKIRLRLEKELLGTYVSEHPLDGMSDVIDENSDISIEDFLEIEGAWSGRLCGVVTSVLAKNTKKGDLMAWVTLEDLTGSVEVLIFPKFWAKFQVAEGEVVSLTGNSKAGENKFFANSSKPLTQRTMTAKPTSALPFVMIRLYKNSPSDLTQEEANELKSCFVAGSGSNPVLLTGSGGQIFSLGEKFPINPNPRNIIKIKSLPFVEEVVTNVTDY